MNATERRRVYNTLGGMSKSGRLGYNWFRFSLNQSINKMVMLISEIEQFQIVCECECI